MSDDEIRQAAVAFAKKNREHLAKELTDIFRYKPSKVPISVFMAGSPGAGKTEFSKNLLAILEKDDERQVVRIDGDEIRSFFPDYNGSNSNLFQGAASLVIEKIHDRVLHSGQNFILDGTFWKYEKACENIRRSLGKNRMVFIFYVFQKPEVAWKFTEAREKVEGRNIPRNAFIDQFLGSMHTIAQVRKDFGEEVVIFFVRKDFEKNTVEEVTVIEPGDTFIDSDLKNGYTREVIEKLII